jgi:KaiC/GvpD/RAD55 family RecA-like ATPase
MYITPLTKICSTFAETKEFFTEYGGVSFFGADNRLKIADLAQGKRNLIVGEPGIGKTLLLRQIKDWLDKEGFTTSLISLRQTGAIELIDEFLNKRSDDHKVLLLDTLDEVRSSLFPSVLQKIEQVSKN